MDPDAPSSSGAHRVAESSDDEDVPIDKTEPTTTYATPLRRNAAGKQPAKKRVAVCRRIFFYKHRVLMSIFLSGGSNFDQFFVNIFDVFIEVQSR